MMRRIAGLLVAGCVLAMPALADDVDCSNATTQYDMNACAVADWKAADAELNASYKDLVALLTQWDDGEALTNREGGVEKLRKAQRAWVAYRDAACEVAGWPMHGGSAEPLLIYGCMRQLTEQRTADLNDLLEYGDM